EKKLGVALGKYANDVYNQGNEKVKHDDLAEAEKDYMQALKIANESKNEGWIKQYSKKLDDFYHSWLKQLEKEVKSASKEGADAKAMAKIIKTALKIAKKTKNEKVIAKYEDELKQYQPAATPASNE
nr:hypothetical protein [Candidatus Sigynarchaeota archaeon]